MEYIIPMGGTKKDDKKYGENACAICLASPKKCHDISRATAHNHNFAKAYNAIIV